MISGKNLTWQKHRAGNQPAQNAIHHYKVDKPSTLAITGGGMKIQKDMKEMNQIQMLMSHSVKHAEQNTWTLSTNERIKY